MTGMTLPQRMRVAMSITRMTMMPVSTLSKGCLPMANWNRVAFWWIYTMVTAVTAISASSSPEMTRSFLVANFMAWRNTITRAKRM